MMEDKVSKYPNNPEQMMWITLAKNGSSVAFNQIVEKYQQPIYNLCYRMLNNNGEEAEDAAQEVFIRAYCKLDSYAETHKFSTWLFSIASHYCIDRLRKRCFQLVSWDDLAPWYSFPGEDVPQPEGTLLKAEADREVRALLDALSPDYRTVIILKY
jgi:RNA polymerase sigma-70 factor (ECF subfamily)